MLIIKTAIMIGFLFPSLGLAGDSLDYKSFEGSYKLESTSGYVRMARDSGAVEQMDLNEFCGKTLTVAETIKSIKDEYTKAVVLMASNPEKLLFSFGWSGILSYGENCNSCSYFPVIETIDEKMFALEMNDDNKVVDLQDSTKVSLTHDKQTLIVSEVRYLKKPFESWNYKCKFTRTEWCRLPQATRTRVACSFADLHHDLGSDILKFNGSCKASLG